MVCVCNVGSDTTAARPRGVNATAGPDRLTRRRPWTMIPVLSQHRTTHWQCSAASSPMGSVARRVRLAVRPAADVEPAGRVPRVHPQVPRRADPRLHRASGDPASADLGRSHRGRLPQLIGTPGRPQETLRKPRQAMGGAACHPFAPARRLTKGRGGHRTPQGGSVRFGIRLGPFWVSTSTRRRRRGPQGFKGITRGEDGREHRCHHDHRTPRLRRNAPSGKLAGATRPSRLPAGRASSA